MKSIEGYKDPRGIVIKPEETRERDEIIKTYKVQICTLLRNAGCIGLVAVCHLCILPRKFFLHSHSESHVVPVFHKSSGSNYT
jgi:hypothetical protein